MSGPLWRSLEERAGTAEFREALAREFPSVRPDAMDAASRREFLQLMAASLALAGLAGCTKQPPEKIVPYVDPPELVVPGRPLYFATATLLGGVATGILAESHMGRPTKVEGNPEHPASLGASDLFSQASVLGLYDPDRSAAVTQSGQIATWGAFVSDLGRALDAQGPKQGAGLRILTGRVTSPTLAEQLRAVLAAFPRAKWHQYEPVHRDAEREGAILAFGSDVVALPWLDRADVVLSLEAELLSDAEGSIPRARAFALGRDVSGGRHGMNRLYAVESTPTLTGAMADHRIPLRPAEIGRFASRIAIELGIGKAGTKPALPPGLERMAVAIAADLGRHRGKAVVVAGRSVPPELHALVHLMNETIGAVGTTVRYVDPPDEEPVPHGESIAALGKDLRERHVDVLVILGANPVYAAPPELGFRERIPSVPFTVHLGSYRDETGDLCLWHVPEAHPLESWGDARAYDGTVTMIQPLIAPLYFARTATELLAAIAGKPGRTGHDILREHWKGSRRDGEADFERFFRSALHDGLVKGTAREPRPVEIRASAEDLLDALAGAKDEGFHVLFRPDPTVWDGRFANNGWLQELPKPLTQLTWGNAALLSPADAERLGVGNGEEVEIEVSGRKVTAPVWLHPGQAEACVTLPLGYGRRRAGRVGDGRGFDAYAVRGGATPWHAGGAKVRKTGGRARLVTTQRHHDMEGRDLLRVRTLEAYVADPRGVPPDPLESLYPARRWEGEQWGMSIDLNLCTGCSACVAACAAENNTPVVGPDQVALGREMHWIRVDRYFEGAPKAPAIHHQPVPCMHCEDAPCEVVCPVGATVHSKDGLNEMVYNRCVGTRYCSNNCPYKVRRFNFLQYADTETPVLKLLRNPDVTVRNRGVMEKCTYCIQRISAARIRAKEEDRPIRDGDVVTACQAACPTGAIVFGNIADPGSRVSRRKAEPRDYGLLASLGTRPRTSYLVRLRNLNPEIAEG